jgi:prophage antirepressor-like protein
MSSQGSNAIQAFVFPQTKQKVRVFVDPDGTLWFVAADVCRELGYAKVWNAIERHCKPEGTAKRSILTDGGTQEVTVINEANLYRLIIRSNAPNAEPFQDWVSEEVLPSIRKTGSYGHKPQQQLDLTNLDPDVMLDALINVQQLRKEEKAKLLELQEEKAKLEVRLEAQTPVVNAIKRLAAAEGSICIQQAAKALKMRPTDLTDHMLNCGWLYMRPPSTRKIAYQEKIKQKWMVCHQDTKSLSGGRELLYVQYKITGLGLLRLARELDFEIDKIESNDD